MNKQCETGSYLCEMKLYNVRAPSITMSMKAEPKQTAFPSGDHNL